MIQRDGFCVVLVLLSITIMMVLLMHVWARQSLSMLLLQHRECFYEKRDLLANALSVACRQLKNRQDHDDPGQISFITSDKAQVNGRNFQVTTLLKLDEKKKDLYLLNIECKDNAGKELSLSGFLLRRADHVIADYITLRPGIR